jgi:DNA polymerase III alpha subunit
MTPEKIERNFEAAGFFITPDVTKLIMALCREERERIIQLVKHEVETTGWVGIDALAAAIRKEKE